jgi:two-component system response regulator HydG
MLFMTFARRLLLVGTDHRFSQTVQTHLHKTFLLTAPVVRTEDVSELVTRETDGVLLFLAADPGDADRIESAVRELRLLQLPPRIATLEAADATPLRRLDPLAGQLDARFSWPDQLRDLNAWVRRAVTPGQPFVDPAAETVSERLRRKLLALTPSLAPLCNQLDIAAAHDVTVLIEGETGTGKTFLARLIHDCSPRAAHRYLSVACGSLPGSQLAAELFGHVKGAFAGADTARVGKLTAAGEGTLFLSEVEALGPEHQASLLRVIETGEFEPVGGSETQTCRARIVAAAGGDLAAAVERGAFRRDLYYRLHVVTLQLPPLRARPEDVGPLARGLTARYGAKFGKKIAAVQPDTLRALEQFAWPGNIRQLENVIQQAVLACDGDALTPAHLPSMIQARPDGRAAEAGFPNSLAQNRETTERAVIVRALEKVGHSRTRASQLLGVSRVTLYKKMKKYGLLAKTANSPAGANGSPEFHV